MAFNNWPYTNFQDLNLGWIISTYKTALNKALEALGKANAVEAEVGTYTDQINAATLTANQASTTANQAMNIARNANEVLFISADAENKAVNYVTWSQGGSGYVTAADIYSAIVTDHKVPVFMDRSQYIYEMAGYETEPNSPLTITRFKFTKNGGNREDIVWIDGTGSITYTTSYSGGTLVVNITRSSGSGTTTSDTTYAAIESAYKNGMTVQCHVVDELNGLEYYAYDCLFTENNDTGDYFGWYSPFDYTNSRFYRAFVRDDGLAGISNIPVSGGGGGTISGAVLYDSVQNLTTAQKAQARENISAQPFYNVYNNSATSGTVTVYDNSTLQLMNTLTGALTIAFETDNSELNSHVRCIRFRTGSTTGACIVTLPSGVEVPLGFYALDGIYLLPNTVYELVIVNGYMTFNFWG